MSKKLKFIVDVIVVPLIISLLVSTDIYAFNYFYNKNTSATKLTDFMLSQSCTNADSTLGCF